MTVEPYTEPDRWIELECPACGNTTFDGQGYHTQGSTRYYKHHCPDCHTLISTPTEIDGETIGTHAP